MGSDIRKVILIAVALMVIGVIIPLAVGLISNAGNVVINVTSGERLSDVADPSVVTLITVLIPIIAVIAIVLMFLPKSKGGG